MTFHSAPRSGLAIALVLALAACGGSSGPTGPSGPPVVTAVNEATLPSGPVGSTVIIEGSNFGSTQGAGQVLFSNGTGGTVAGAITTASDWSNVFIITTVPSGAATGNLVLQTVGGSSTPVTFTVTQNAPFSPSTVSWTSTSPLPLGLSGHAAAFAEIRGASTTTRVLYVIGGADSTDTPLDTVFYATVGGSGSINAWTATTSLPKARAFHRAVVATPSNSVVTGAGYIYVLGGATTAAGQPSDSVFRGTIASDGTLSAWTLVGRLPTPLHSFGAAIFLGNLYVWGGATTGNVPVATAYRASIDASGGLGTWQTEVSLPFKRAYFGFGAFGGYLYAFGGDSGTVTPNDSSVLGGTKIADVVYARIDLHTRDLMAAGWTLSPNHLTKTVVKHTTVVAGGNILVTAGLYNGAVMGSTEESYAQLNGDGSTGTFNGATGSNTINAAGGGNLFNHAATGYVDGNGTFHVLVVGGDDVNNPGKKHKTAFYY
jgi:hypothetical protein